MNKKEERIFFTLSNVLDRKDTKTAEDILASCPSILSTKWKGMTLLYVACMRNRAYAASFLLEHGADVNVRDRRGDTPLHIACYYGNHGVARLLLEHGAEVDASDTDGWTPLHNACFDGHAATVRLLLSHGAEVSVDRKDTGGHTPLHWACENGKKPVISLLLKAGANPWIGNRDEILPIDIVRSKDEGPEREDIERVFDRDGGVNESTLGYYREKYPVSV